MFDGWEHLAVGVSRSGNFVLKSIGLGGVHRFTKHDGCMMSNRILRFDPIKELERSFHRLYVIVMFVTIEILRLAKKQ